MAQGFPFRYIPDPGDGTGVAQALAEVAAAGQRGDVYLRPGIYDFGMLTSPPLPLSVPSSTSLRGPGTGVVPGAAGQPEAGVLLRASPTQRQLLAMQPTSSIRQLAFELTSPVPGAVGDQLVGGVPGATLFVDQVAVFITADPVASANESLSAVIRGGFLTINEVAISTFGEPPYYTGGLIGVDGEDVFINQFLLQGVDVGVRMAQGGTIVNVTMIEPVLGVDVVNGGIRITDLLVFGGQGMVVRPGGYIFLENAALFGFTPSGPGPVGIEMQPFSGGVVSNCRIEGYEDCIRAEAQTQVTNTRIGAVQHGIRLVDAPQSTITGCLLQGFGSGTGILVDAPSEDATIGNNIVRTFSEGIRLESSFTTAVANNLRNNGTPLVDNGTSSELGHNQL